MRLPLDNDYDGDPNEEVILIWLNEERTNKTRPNARPWLTYVSPDTHLPYQFKRGDIKTLAPNAVNTHPHSQDHPLIIPVEEARRSLGISNFTPYTPPTTPTT